MVGERIQSRRPFTSAILSMLIRQSPEPPEAEPVLPKDVATAVQNMVDEGYQFVNTKFK